MKFKVMLTLVISLFFTHAYADMKPMSDDEIRVVIMNGVLESFTGECPCPTSKDKMGKACGENSEYFRSKGKIICYKQDISDADVNAYRLKYSIADPKGTQLQK